MAVVFLKYLNSNLKAVLSRKRNRFGQCKAHRTATSFIDSGNPRSVHKCPGKVPVTGKNAGLNPETEAWNFHHMPTARTAHLGTFDQTRGPKPKPQPSRLREVMGSGLAAS